MAASLGNRKNRFGKERIQLLDGACKKNMQEPEYFFSTGRMRRLRLEHMSRVGDEQEEGSERCGRGEQGTRLQFCEIESGHQTDGQRDQEDAEESGIDIETGAAGEQVQVKGQENHRDAEQVGEIAAEE